MKNIRVKITYKTGRYVPTNENTEIVISHSEEQAVHDLVARFLYFNPSYKIKIIKTEIVNQNSQERNRGHEVSIVSYGDWDNQEDICLECEDCGEVILDAEIYTLCTRED